MIRLNAYPISESFESQLEELEFKHSPNRAIDSLTARDTSDFE